MSDLTADPSPTDLEAAAWYLRLRQPVSADAIHEFYAWRRNAANAKAYAEVEATWERNRRLANDPEIQAATAAALRGRPAKARLRRAGMPGVGPFAIGATLAAALAFAAGTTRMFGQAQTYDTRVGEQRLIVLQDGSRVRLNTNSRLIVRFRRDERRVVLARGEAFFEAAHNAARPFVVEAEDARVRAIGTKFDVRRDDGTVRVTLLEGRVRVAQAEGQGAAVLTPNQALTVTRTGISAPHKTDADEAAGWTSGRLTFHGVALDDAITEVNRYAAHKIELTGPASLAQQPISGVFDVGDTTAFLSAVKLEFDLQTVADPTGAIRLSPRQPTPAA